MRLGTAEYSCPVLLAPMAGVTDGPFRELCRQAGCDFTFTEMVSAKGIYYGGKNTAGLLATTPGERPCGVQLFGRDPAIMADTARTISEKYQNEISLIDINMGCPAHKIVKNGEGSALMLELPLASRVIRAVVAASSLPVSVKFRKGFDGEHINAPEFAMMAEESGACHITVHGRTREQLYSGRADWDIIARVKQQVSIPVIGNGDVFSAADAKALLTHTNCDGVMVARGAQGNPFIFSEIRALLQNEPYLAPTPRERVDMAAEHARRLVAAKGERAIVEMRKHAAWYIKGLPGAAGIRGRINECATLSEMLTLLYNIEAVSLDKGIPLPYNSM